MAAFSPNATVVENDISAPFLLIKFSSKYASCFSESPGFISSKIYSKALSPSKHAFLIFSISKDVFVILRLFKFADFNSEITSSSLLNSDTQMSVSSIPKVFIFCFKVISLRAL